jgi:hypothetical protein
LTTFNRDSSSFLAYPIGPEGSAVVYKMDEAGKINKVTNTSNSKLVICFNVSLTVSKIKSHCYLVRESEEFNT